MTKKIKLRRALTLPMLILYGLGNILGAGIYVLVGKVAGISEGHAILAFIVAAFIAGLTAFSYMELSSRYPVSASESVYVHHGFGLKSLSQAVGFLMLLTALFSSATLARGFVGYFVELIAVNETLAMAGLFIVLGGVVAWGIRSTAWLVGAFTVVELLGLLSIIWSGRHDIFQVVSYQSFSFSTWDNVGPILLGAFLAFYAYIGFEDMVNVAEEVEQPKRMMPIALLVILAVSTILYVLVVIVVTNTIPLDKLAASKAPLSLVFSKLTDMDPWVITLIAIAATVNGILVHIVLMTRVLYGMAQRGWVHRVLGRVYAKTQTPILATALSAGAIFMMAVSFPIVSLAQMTSFSLLLVFALVNGALIRIKQRPKAVSNVVTVPLLVPWLGMLSCVFLFSYQIYRFVF